MAADTSVLPEPQSHLYIEGENMALCGHSREVGEIDEGHDMDPVRQRYFDCAECWERFREMSDV